jgi:GntR family transcriptional regulator/MocR family aminotransferase
MRLALDRENSSPLYQQIENYFRAGILSGSLAAETRLPASRQLARDLGVNRMTVESAYARLEADGLVFFKLGSGTYVLGAPSFASAASRPDSGPLPVWQQVIQATELLQPSQYAGEELKIASGPDAIHFAGGTGDPELSPVAEFRKVVQAVMRRDGISALEYGEPRGYSPLRVTIAQVLASQGIQAQPENILITSGSQQAIALTAQLLLREGQTVLVESPTYGGALDLFRQLRLQVLSVPVDEQGLQVDGLDALFERVRPGLIYSMPDFHNPTGVCLSSPRRHKLMELANRYEIPILEDDYVGDLRYEGHAQPSLKALDTRGLVIYTSTFSKMLMPGLRIGFLVANGPVFEALARSKRATDLATCNLMQRSLEAYVTVGRYQAHLRKSCHLYKSRRDTLLQACRRYLPADVQFTAPRGGLFVWLRLPGQMEAEALLPLACRAGVDFVSGSSFFPNPVDGAHFLRLNFAMLQREQISAGIQRLGLVIEQFS